MSKIRWLTLAFLCFVTFGFAQPHTDIASFTYQYFASNYKSDTSLKNQTNQYTLNVFLPKEFKNGNVFLLRINTEVLHSTVSNLDESATLSSVSLPIGMQFASKSKKWKTIIMAIPKIASNFESAITSKDFQLGALLLENYSPNSNLKLKAGLYFNNEAFGPFFVPLLGIDWKASERLHMFGILPTNYKIEYKVVKGKWYTGLDFKSLIRSFHLTESQEYVRFDEIVLKLFAECYVYKNVVLSSQIGYSFGKNPIQYSLLTDEESNANVLYSLTNNYPLFNFGISYRLRNDLGK
jgi:hypothetical protein